MWGEDSSAIWSCRSWPNEQVSPCFVACDVHTDPSQNGHRSNLLTVRLHNLAFLLHARRRNDILVNPIVRRLIRNPANNSHTNQPHPLQRKMKRHIVDQQIPRCGNLKRSAKRRKSSILAAVFLQGLAVSLAVLRTFYEE